MLRKTIINKLFCIILIQSVVTGSAYATQITISNLDAAGEGFNDTTPVSSVGSNPGTTLGEQRLKVFEHAAKIWESIVDSNVETIVEARFDPQTCTATSAILGSAGANTLHRDFANAPLSNTWYSGAQANSLANFDLSTAAEVSATFNSAIDNNNNCLRNTDWYYGLDGNRPAGTIELLSVVMHEIGHGLGFLTFVNVPTGARFFNRNDVYMLNLEDHSSDQTWDQLSNAQRVASSIDTGDLHWIGPNVTARIGDLAAGFGNGHVEMYAPDPLQSGSSVSHFSKGLSPNELMEPSDTGPKATPGLAKDLFLDLGWVAFADSKPFMSSLADNSVLQGDTLQIDFVIGDNDTALSSLTLDASSSNTSLLDAAGLSFSGSGNVRTLSIIAPTANTGSTTIDVSVSDGISAATKSFNLTVQFNNPPLLNVLSPADNSVFTAADIISFQASATDVEDGDVSGSIQWGSTLDGNIGSGASFTSSLSLGVHSITASVTDSLGKAASQARSITVSAPGDSDGDGMEDAWEISNFGTLGRDGSGDYDIDGLPDADEAALNTIPTDSDTDGDGVTDGDEVNLHGIDPTLSNAGDVGPRGSPDNQLNAGDLAVLTRLATGAIPQPTALESILADINTDGQLNAADILLLQQAILNAVSP